ncbi:MAG: methyltransferase domain-containing protein [Candidatus Sphingomonas phytovorans]|nr:methyltransferase domain-containing protein [Sphingomonas sp.]WEJ99749.1 MAG: methyltransferase domain-containing protein [Sphingomonas sp.]
MTTDELGAEIRRLGPWHHDIEIAPGIRTGDPAYRPEPDPALGTPSIVDPYAKFARAFGDLFPEGLRGRSFLDCACNAGGYLFAARRMGAGRCFGFDVREHWIRQAHFLAGRLPSADIDAGVCALADVPELGLKPFDVTLFSGILYHLPDPVAGLKIAADLTREVLIVNTETFPAKQDGLILNPESRTLLMSGVDGLAWYPTGETVVRQMLASCGFPHTRLRFNHATEGKRRRLEIWAARDPGVFSHYDGLYPQVPPSRLRRLTARLLGRR